MTTKSSCQANGAFYSFVLRAWANGVCVSSVDIVDLILTWMYASYRWGVMLTF